MPLRILDSAVLLRVEPDEVFESVARLLAPFAVDRINDSLPRHVWALAEHRNSAEVPASSYALYRDGTAMATRPTWALTVASLAAALNRTAIDEYQGLAVHAGVVASQGRAIAFPADSGGGKSTLVAACVAAGFDYVSDEALCVDRDRGHVVPYPKPLGLSAWTRERLDLNEEAVAFPAGRSEALITAQDLGGAVAQGHLELAVITLPAQVDRLDLQPGSAGLGMVALLEHSFNHYKLGERAFTLAAQLANQVEVWLLDYDDPVRAAQLLKSRWS